MSHAYVEGADGSKTPITTAIKDHAYLRGQFVASVQGRGRDVIMARKLSSAMSAAKAIGDHMRVWYFGTADGEITSMSVMSDGSYGIEPDLMYSQPVTIKDGVITIFGGLTIDDYSREKMEKTKEELVGTCVQAILRLFLYCKLSRGDITVGHDVLEGMCGPGRREQCLINMLLGDTRDRLTNDPRRYDYAIAVFELHGV